MKIPIIFNIDQDLAQTCKDMENRSLFLNDLLRETFNKDKPLTLIKQEKEKKAMELVQEAEQLETEISKEEKAKQEAKAKMDAEYDIEMQEKKKRVSDMIKATWRESFTRNWNIPPERLEDLFNEFVELNERKETTIIEFMQFKLISPKIKNNQSVSES